MAKFQTARVQAGTVHSPVSVVRPDSAFIKDRQSPTTLSMSKDEINVPIALSAFRESFYDMLESLMKQQRCMHLQ